MNPDSMVFVAKPRKGYEALDLGFIMVRQWWKTLYASWLVVTFPLFLVLLWAFDGNGIPSLILWWFKPLFERLHLFILSRAVFGERPGWRETVSGFWRYGRTQVIQSLTWRRLSPTRSLDLAVIQLEGLKGVARTQRLNVLHRDKTGSVAGWLTVVGIHIEAIIELSIVAAIVMFLPQHMDLDIFSALGAPYIADSLFYIAMTLFSPFYVAGGFALYLNRRTLLEGWDIELSFRRLLGRVEKVGRVEKTGRVGRVGGGAVLSTTLIVALLSASLFLNPQMVMAEESTGYSKASAKADIQAVLDGGDFHQRETERLPKFIADWDYEPNKDEKKIPLNIPEWLKDIIKFVAASIETILWLAMAGAILLLIYRYRNTIVSFTLPKRQQKNNTAPNTLFDLEVSKASLPEDIPAAVLALWANNQQREATSLLYRGTLSRLIHQYKMSFKQGDTERDCTCLVRKHAALEVSRYFVKLTSAWELMAYGHTLPQYEEISALCNTWPSLFSETLYTGESVVDKDHHDKA